MIKLTKTVEDILDLGNSDEVEHATTLNGQRPLSVEPFHEANAYVESHSDQAFSKLTITSPGQPAPEAMEPWSGLNTRMNVSSEHSSG